MSDKPVYIPERVPFRGSHYVEAEAFDRCFATLKSTEAQLEQERVQHAGCLTAAEGHTREPAKPGDYGWSLAYQKVLELRLRFDALSKPAPSAAAQPFWKRIFRR